MDVFEHMRIFIHVVDAGSFTNAADALGVHKPAITKAVQQLEKMLGTRLLHRTTRKMGVTPEGEEFYQRCLKILGDVSETFAIFSSATDGVEGKLRVDLPLTLAKTLIIPALPQFQKRYPDINLVIGVSDQEVDIVAEGIDCVVRLGDLRDSTLIARKIGAIPMLTCASPSYLAEFGTPTKLKHLSTHKAVNYFSGPHRKLMEWQYIVDGEVTSFKLKSGILVNDSEAFLSCGLAGFGLMHGLKPTLETYIASGELIRLLPDIASPSKSISILYPHKHYLAPKVRVFADWLADLMVSKGLSV